MFGQLLVIGIVSGLGLLGYRKLEKGQHGEETPARKLIFENAMRTPGLTPDKLRFLADSFDKEGLRHYAAQLRQRAANAELPEETKQAHQAVFRKAMQSKNPEAVEKVAQAFADMQKTASAEQLRTYAKGLRAALQVHVQESPPAAPPEEEDPQKPETDATSTVRATDEKAAPIAHGDRGAVSGIANGIRTNTDNNVTTSREV